MNGIVILALLLAVVGTICSAGSFLQCTTCFLTEEMALLNRNRSGWLRRFKAQYAVERGFSAGFAR